MALSDEQIDAAEADLLAAMSDPQSVQTDAGSVTMPSLSARMMALRQLRANRAAKKGGCGPGILHICKAAPPGAA